MLHVYFVFFFQFNQTENKKMSAKIFISQLVYFAFKYFLDFAISFKITR